MWLQVNMHMGKKVPFAPGARMDDGLLDLVLVRKSGGPDVSAEVCRRDGQSAALAAAGQATLGSFLAQARVALGRATYMGAAVSLVATRRRRSVRFAGIDILRANALARSGAHVALPFVDVRPCHYPDIYRCCMHMHMHMRMCMHMSHVHAHVHVHPRVHARAHI